MKLYKVQLLPIWWNWPVPIMFYIGGKERLLMITDASWLSIFFANFLFINLKIKKFSFCLLIKKCVMFIALLTNKWLALQTDEINNSR